MKIDKKMLNMYVYSLNEFKKGFVLLPTPRVTDRHQNKNPKHGGEGPSTGFGIKCNFITNLDDRYFNLEMYCINVNFLLFF